MHGMFESLPYVVVAERKRKYSARQKDVEKMCEICGKIVRCSGLERHRKTHSDQRDFHCTLCDKKFIQKDHLISHMSTHSDERNFKCNVCNASFKRKKSLQKHSNVHWLGNFGFEATSTVSSTSSNHSRGNFQCMVCKDLDFEEEKLLLKHIRDCHVIKHSAETKSPKAETPNLRYQCMLCNKLVMEKSLIKHNLSHKNVNGNKRAYTVLKKDPESNAQNAESGEVDVENNSTTPDNITDIITEVSTESTESGDGDKETNNAMANAENESFCKGTSLEPPKKLSSGLKAEGGNSVIRNVVKDKHVDFYGNGATENEIIEIKIEVDEDVSEIIFASDSY